jgi:hypothetical protein
VLEEAIDVGRFDVAQSDALLLEVPDEPPDLPPAGSASGFRRPATFMLDRDKVLDLAVVAPRCFRRR